MQHGPSLVGRALVAVVLTLLFYGLALGLVVAFGWMIWADVEHGRPHGRLIVWGVLTIAVVVWSIAPRIDRFPDPGVRLERTGQPELFATIEDVARRTGQAMPAEVFLIGDVNAFVAQRGGVLGIGSRRVLGVGLPLLETLTVPQLAAVLAHEFGHFHGGDTRLGPWIYATRSAIARTIVNFARVGSLWHVPFQWYGKLFLRVTHAISRRQELAADALAVQVAGAGAAASALSTIAATAPLYEHYVTNEFAAVLNAGVRPPLCEGFRRFLRSPSMVRAREEIAAEAQTVATDPYDTHPPLAERLAAIGAAAHEARDVEGAPAASLLRDLPQLERELLVFLGGDDAIGRLPALCWEDATARALPRIWQAAAFDYCLLLPPLTVADVAAQRERAVDLARMLGAKNATPEQSASIVSSVLGAILAYRLHVAGFAIDAQPGHPIRLRRDDVVVEPLEVLPPGHAGVADAAWRQLCAEAGIGELPLTGPAARPASRTPV